MVGNGLYQINKCTDIRQYSDSRETLLCIVPAPLGPSARKELMAIMGYCVGPVVLSETVRVETLFRSE